MRLLTINKKVGAYSIFIKIEMNLFGTGNDNNSEGRSLRRRKNHLSVVVV